MSGWRPSAFIRGCLADRPSKIAKKNVQAPLSRGGHAIKLESHPFPALIGHLLDVLPSLRPLPSFSGFS
ncbi:hypothetical protein, partial [Haemophilus parainfluenzae]|uniref:hypothetical protein n=1 Tax=Haemophilus parainfluenzae TaxID=729 RepID=UPI001CED3D37